MRQRDLFTRRFGRTTLRLSFILLFNWALLKVERCRGLFAIRSRLRFGRWFPSAKSEVGKSQFGLFLRNIR